MKSVSRPAGKQSLHGQYRRFRRHVQDSVLHTLGCKRERLSPGWIDPTASRPCAAPTRPARGVSGSWIRQVKNTVLNVSSEARSNEILCKPMEEQNQRLITGTKSALRSWLLIDVPTLICPCKPFLCKACPEITSQHITSHETAWHQMTPHDFKAQAPLSIKACPISAYEIALCSLTG